MTGIGYAACRGAQERRIITLNGLQIPAPSYARRYVETEVVEVLQHL